MSTPSSRISPVWRVPSIRSFIRLSERRKVDLPHPDGPISATTDRSGTVSEMSQSACLGPYQNDIPLTRNFVCTPLRLVRSRPFSVRSEMMAEYERVDMRHLRRPIATGACDTRGLFYGTCV